DKLVTGVQTCALPIFGGGVSAPKAIYSPEPEYSDEARHSKYQGSVILSAVVGPDGRAHDIRVARSLGMGLDERAIQAVRTWRFRSEERRVGKEGMSRW